MSLAADRISLLELDLDIRLRDLWMETEAVKSWDISLAAKFVRAAYTKGYNDALSDEPRGRLFSDHGYEVPGRQR